MLLKDTSKSFKLKHPSNGCNLFIEQLDADNTSNRGQYPIFK